MTNITNLVITQDVQETISKHIQAIAKSSFDLTIFMAYELTVLDTEQHKNDLLDYFSTICAENDLSQDTAKRYITDIKSVAVFAGTFATFSGFKNALKKHGINKVSHLPLWLNREKSLKLAIGKLPRDLREPLADKIASLNTVKDVQNLNLEIKDAAAAAEKAAAEKAAAEKAAAEKAAAEKAAVEKAVADTKAADTKAADTKAADTKAADTKAVDTKVAVVKPQTNKGKIASSLALPESQYMAICEALRIASDEQLDSLLLVIEHQQTLRKVLDLKTA